MSLVEQPPGSAPAAEVGAGMAARVAALDWSQTPLGPIDRWPQSLRTLVDVLLAHPLPMILLWGPELTQIYNDGYAVIAGGKHPAALGRPNRECWPEALPLTEPIYQRVLSRGESVLLTDQLIPLDRHGRGALQDAYFTVNYGPCRDEGGQIAGILVTVIETTDKVLAERERERWQAEASRREALLQVEQRAQVLDAALTHIDDFAYIFDRDGRFLYVNRPLLDLWGLTLEEAVGKNFFDLKYPDELAAKHQREIQQVIDTKRRLTGESRYTSPRGVTGYYEYIFNPVLNKDGEVEAVTGSTRDITARVGADEARRMVEFRFQRLVEHSPQSTQLFHPDGRTRQVNRAFERLFGITLDQLRDYNILRDPELVRLGVIPLMERAFAGEAVTIQPIAYVPDRGQYAGQTRWAGAYVYPVKDDAGRIEEVVLVHNDVTEQRLAEVAVRQSEQRLRSLVEQSAAGIAHTDLTGRILFTNERFRQTVGYPMEELLRLRVHDLTHPDDLPETTRLVAGGAATGRDYAMEKRYVRRDGSVVWVAVSASVIKDAAGRPESIMGVVVDVTDRKLAEAAVRASEERYRTLFESIDDGFCVIEVLFDDAGVATDYRFLEVNRAFEEQTGIVEAVGRRMRDIAPGHEPRWFELYGRIARTGEPLRFENEAAALGHYYEVHAFRVGEPAQRRVAILFRDVAERKRAEAALRDSEERLRLAVAIARMGTFEIDLRTDDVAVNDEGRDIYGWAPAEPLTFARVQTHFHPDDRERVLARVADALRPDGPEEFVVEQRIVRTDGVTRWIRVRGRAIFEGAGSGRRAVRCVGTYLDVTDQKEAERERERLLERERAARAEAEHAGRMKDEFLATLSHELRTPLNAILGWSQILGSSSRDEDDLAEGLRTIERNARAQTQIIEDLLDMSRIISGKVRLEVRRVDLASVVGEAVATARPSAEAKGVRLQAVLDPHAGTVSGDPARLQQVMWNLLSNAVKFTPRGGRVEVLLKRLDSQLDVSVSDTGEGIPTEFLPHVFDRFRQADASTTRRHGGLGLGLSIAKQLVELHGGSIRVASAGGGGGTTFTVSLPLPEVQREADQDGARQHPQALSSTGGLAEPCVQMAGVTVLVVDDEPDARALVRRLLEDCQARVMTAGSAAEAIDLVRAERPDVLVCDIGMPDEDGYSLIRRVRALAPEHGGRVPSAALTAYARGEDRVKAVLAGFQMHLAKPVEPAELIAAVAALAGRTGG